MAKINAIADVLARTTRDGDCVVYTGERIWNGYGRVGYQGRRQLVHRVVYEHHFGPIPAGMFVCHRCDNRACCNPHHLFLGTASDNMSDAAAKGRLHRPLGESAPAAKLRAVDIPAIRARYAAGESLRSIAFSYGVTPHCIQKITSRKNWRHVA